MSRICFYWLLLAIISRLHCNAFVQSFDRKCAPIRSAFEVAARSSDVDLFSCKETQVTLSDGVKMQVLYQIPGKGQKDYAVKNPLLIFLHGSFHAAWCWAEYYFPYFVERGYPVLAPSWRGTGGTFAGDGVKKVKIQQHVQDLSLLLEQVPRMTGLENMRPVVVCHSFGGLAVMKYLEQQLVDEKQTVPFAGIVTMCSVPPSGNAKMTLRFLRRSLRQSWRITIGFAMKKLVTDASLCRQLFFGGDKVTMPDGTIDNLGVSDEDIQRYQTYFARDSVATIDLMDLSNKLPSLRSQNGVAPFVHQLPPCLVMGAAFDAIVDQEGLEETARYFGLTTPIIVDSPHDVMLGAKWQTGAKALERWLDETKPR